MENKNKSFLKRFPASISVTAMITTVILLMIAAALINMVYFSLINSNRDAEYNRARWFLEGRVQEYMDAILSGKDTPKVGTWRYKEPIESHQQQYTFTIALKKGRYSLHARMRWKKRYPVEEYIEFSRLNLFYYTLFFNKSQEFKLDHNMLVYGNIGVNGKLKINSFPGVALYLYAGKDFMPHIDYASEKPDLTPKLFQNPLRDFISDNTINLKFINSDLSLDKIMRQNQAFQDLKIPDFDQIWNAFSQHYDPSWFINDNSFFDTVSIVNFVSSEKDLLSFGNGASTRFDVGNHRFFHVYIKAHVPNWPIQNITSLDYSYFSGHQNRNQFYKIENGQLILEASESPVSILLPEEAYRTFGHFYLAGKEWSYISRDERIAEIFLNSVHPSSRLIPGLDFQYKPSDRSIEILNSAFYKKHTFNIGMGTGNQSTFSYNNMGGRIYIYQGWKRTTAFSAMFGRIVFNNPPPAGVPIRGMQNPPVIFMRKVPPVEGSAIFVDHREDVIVLDLDEIQNYPQNGVILANKPLLIKGTASENLAIISSENIYIESLNPNGKGHPVLLASRRGVWIYREANKSDTKIYKALIYSPLNALYSVSETGDFQNPPISIHGSVIFTGEYANGSMDLPYFAKNFYYDSSILSELKKPPFSYFPMPVEISLVRRH